MRRALLKETAKRLPNWINQAPHFEPRYNPWEQRICVDADGAFYDALHRSNVKLITGKIETVTQGAILTEGDKRIDADIIITATGLNMKLGGGIEIRVDGAIMPWSNRFIWNGAMIEGVPNMVFMFGYTNNAWTLGADDTAIIMIRLWKYMSRNGVKSAVPLFPNGVPRETERMWQLSSTYAVLAEDRLPVYGKTGPWKSRTRPPIDYIHARLGDYTSGLHFSV
ncbi:hypothetical protein DL771_002820 [Monosporascus sp. 5C6A]|nr:hypothetical protein DL771_002820 [Monosporascus sp. 5C6A]